MTSSRPIVNSTKHIASAALSRRTRAPDVQEQVFKKLVNEPKSSLPITGAEKLKLDLTSTQLFNNHLPECVKSAVIQQMVEPRSAEAIEHNLKKKYAEVAQGRYKCFDFFDTPREALNLAVRQIKNSTGRTKVFHALGASHEVSGIHSKSFLAEVDSWDDSVLLGALHQKLSNSHPHTVAALILSPYSPDNGFQAYSKDFVLGVQDLCRRYGIQLVVDETPIGLGRTGPAFAFSSYKDLTPDVLITAVPSADFLPVTLVCSNNNHSRDETIHPVSMASADASIKFFIDNNLPSRTAEKSMLLKRELKSGLERSWTHGLCGGIELPGPLSTKAMLAENNVYVNSMRGGVCFQLPLLASDEDIFTASNMFRLFSKLKNKRPWDASLPLA